MKKREWVNGNHMLFESPHKTFNKQVDCISTGNVMGHVQLSCHVRSYNEIECNGNIRPKGHLQEYDLNWIAEKFPHYVKDFARKTFIDEGGWLYEFRYWKGSEKYVMGYVATTYEHNLLKYWNTAGAFKSEEVLEEAIKYITNKGEKYETHINN